MKESWRVAGLACLVVLLGIGITALMHSIHLHQRHIAAFDRATVFDAVNKPIGGEIIEGWVATVQDNSPVTLPQAVSIVQCFWESGHPSIHDVDQEVEELKQMQAGTAKEAMTYALRIAQQRDTEEVSENIWCDGLREKLDRAD